MHSACNIPQVLCCFRTLEEVSFLHNLALLLSRQRMPFCALRRCGICLHATRASLHLSEPHFTAASPVHPSVNNTHRYCMRVCCAAAVVCMLNQQSAWSRSFKHECAVHAALCSALSNNAACSDNESGQVGRHLCGALGCLAQHSCTPCLCFCLCSTHFCCMLASTRLA